MSLELTFLISLDTVLPLEITRRVRAITRITYIYFSFCCLTLAAVPDPKDCEDVLKAGNGQSGIYTVKPPNEQTGIQVYCDMDSAGGGWLVCSWFIY